jgi:hypothetical protein
MVTLEQLGDYSDSLTNTAFSLSKSQGRLPVKPSGVIDRVKSWKLSPARLGFRLSSK